MEVVINAILTIIGIAMLCYGGNWLVNGGVAIAQKLRVSKMLIGLTIVAYGTSTPELAASIAAAGEHGAIILGNVIGSNIANIGMVIGISAILIPLVVKKIQVQKEIPIMLGVSFLLVLLSLDGEISQYDGILLLVSMIIFTIFTYNDVKKQRRIANESKYEILEKKISTNTIILFGIGILLLYFGAILTINNAVILAEFFGLHERIIGITIIAIGTSIPELVTSIIAIRKKHIDIGVGNIIGSNIYNILMVMGVGATIAGITISSEVFVDYMVMIGFAFVMFIVLKTGLITKKIGIGFVAAYAIYLVLIF
ncbi:MAG TPA: calcium/sodium antiporter [Nitrosopumilaceae archaeon]|nr:calcium/sodium antiporter [Nitrosopumilaceae archaeon]